MPGFDHEALRTAIAASARTRWNDAAEVLLARAVAAGEGRLTAGGGLAVTTGAYTGRSARDKFIVRDSETQDRIHWENAAAMDPAHFEALLEDFRTALADTELYAQALSAGADPAHRLDVTVFTATAWHSLFIRSLLRADAVAANAHKVSIVHLPHFAADPTRHGTRSQTVIALDLSRRIILIGGTGYAGEIKKAVFSLFNYLAPQRDVLPMHCAANTGAEGDVALFFGLSGTGKTTLSSDPARRLIGDDEHGWSDEGIFNLEGGCYAKTARLSRAAEPEIFAATLHPGTILENVVVDANGVPDFDDLSLTENTRAAYSLATLPRAAADGRGAHPANVVFLTADAFGVLPPLARLTPEEAAYHFLQGYTAKIAGTERGVTEPVATFSACFGAPFMPLHPRAYGEMLAARLATSGARTWLVNTGWTGGSYGRGRRIDIATTRRLLAAALAGELEAAPMRRDPTFGFAVPTAVAGVAADLLDPRQGWADKAAYDAAAQRLALLFEENLRRLDPLPRAAE